MRLRCYAALTQHNTCFIIKKVKNSIDKISGQAKQGQYIIYNLTDRKVSVIFL